MEDDSRHQSQISTCIYECVSYPWENVCTRNTHACIHTHTHIHTTWKKNSFRFATFSQMFTLIECWKASHKSVNLLIFTQNIHHSAWASLIFDSVLPCYWHILSWSRAVRTEKKACKFVAYWGTPASLVWNHARFETHYSCMQSIPYEITCSSHNSQFFEFQCDSNFSWALKIL